MGWASHNVNLDAGFGEVKRFLCYGSILLQESVSNNDFPEFGALGPDYNIL